jgi:phage terminase large subunit GpA-like protein
MSRLTQIIETAAKIILPPPERDAGQWAEDCRHLPPDSPEPGPFRVSRTPYMRDIYAAFADDRYKTVIGVMGAQMGKTEAVFNVLGWSLDDRPIPCMYVGPTEKQVRSISNDRLAKMLRSTSGLWEKLEKGQRNKVSEKFIAGVRLGFAWAGSATELASHPVGLVMVDERDRMVNTDEGDPVTLATARTKNYQRGTVGIFSTPTIEGASPIWSLFLEGTRMMWAWTCLHCESEFVPKLEYLRWPSGSTPGEAGAAATVFCPHCGAEHTDADKHKLELTGRYLPHRVNRNNDLELDPDPPANNTASFWVSGLASPWQSFGDIAQRLVAAYATNDQDRIQAEINTYGGEIFKYRGEAPAWEEVAGLKLPYARRSVPDGVQKITAGVDVQKYGIYYVVRGWGYMSESWLLDNGFIAGETEYDQVWTALGNVLDAEFDGRRIERAFVDSGYETARVYEFVRRHGRGAFPTKGRDTMEKPVRLSKIEVNQRGRVKPSGLHLWNIHTDYFKSHVHSRIRWPIDQAGGFHIHEETEEDYCRQLVAESRVVKPSGKAVWIQHDKDNHYFDCEQLAFAAGYTLAVHTLKDVTTSPKRLSARPLSSRLPRGIRI